MQRGHLDRRHNIANPHFFMTTQAGLIDALGTVVALEAVVRLILIQGVGLLMMPGSSGSAGCFVAIRTRIRTRRSDALFLVAGKTGEVICARSQVVRLRSGRFQAGGGMTATAIEIACDNAAVTGAAGIAHVRWRRVMLFYKIDLRTHEFMAIEAFLCRDWYGRTIVMTGVTTEHGYVHHIMVLVRIFGGDRPVFHEVVTTGTA